MEEGWRCEPPLIKVQLAKVQNQTKDWYTMTTTQVYSMDWNEEEPKQSYGPGLEEIYYPIKLEHLQMGGQCFTCQEEGHYAQYCPKKAEDVNWKGLTCNKKLDPLEIQHLRNKGRCFHCKQTGHVSRQCPKTQEKQQPSCPKEGSETMDNEDSDTVVEELGQT